MNLPYLPEIELTLGPKTILQIRYIISTQCAGVISLILSNAE
jgi:hypothetical protein